MVQLELARNLLFLFLNMEANHSSEECQLYIGSDQDGLLESLQSGLQAGMQPHALPNRTERDEAQVTSIFRKLLELSGFGTDRLRHDLDNDYTASENSDFCASVFGMPRTSTFGEFDTETMSTILSRAKVFKGVEISAEYLQRRTVMMKSFLRIGLAEEHRVRFTAPFVLLLMNLESSSDVARESQYWPARCVQRLPVSVEHQRMRRNPEED